MGPDILAAVGHRPYPLPAGAWRLRQRWNDLLFAHWPVRGEEIARLLPAGLEVDLFDGFAWVGVVPFWMDGVVTRSVGEGTFGVPGTGTFPELNLRTYVRSRGVAGVFFFSLDAGSLLAVVGARVLFGLPYFYARMARVTTEAGVEYRSRRLWTREPVRFEASYRPVGAVLGVSQPGSIEYFLTERYGLFVARFGAVAVGHVHHLPWPLQAAEAEIRVNEIAGVHGITLPGKAPLLHFSRRLEVFIWALRRG
jgi:uncharacterized protein YqjF (DUF2071 family)